MNWIRTDYDFGVPVKQLDLPLSHAHACNKIRDMLKHEGDLPLLAELATALIVEPRPSLKGCTLFAFGYNMERKVWSFHVFHPDFKRVNYAIESEPLIPRPENDNRPVEQDHSRARREGGGDLPGHQPELGENGGGG